MALDESKKKEFKARLRSMTAEEIRLGLDTATIALEWERSLAEQELERRERASREASELARLERENDRLHTELTNNSTALRHSRIGLWIAGGALLLSVLAHIFR